MGILDSLREISKYKKHERKDKILEKELMKSTISDGLFMTRYNSFIESLDKELKEQFNLNDHKKVIYKPTMTENAKFFHQSMKDNRITDGYHVEHFPDGSYSYEPKVLDI